MEASLAEAKVQAEEAGGTDSQLNKAVEEAEIALSDAKTSQDPIKRELERVGEKKLTKVERLRFAKKKIEEQLSELDEDNGVKAIIGEDDDEPLTVGKYKQMQKDQGKKNALELADEIKDEDERELTKHYLEHRIVPSGDAEADVKLARAAVNSLKNAQIAEEMSRGGGAKKKPSSPGNPAKHESAFEPTDEELVFMAPPYNLSKEAILKAREADQQQ